MGWFRGVGGSIVFALFALFATLVTPGVAGAEPVGPVIASFSPAVAAAGAEVTVVGSGLDPTSTIAAEVNGVSAQIVSATDSELKLVVPAGAGSGPISVSGPGGEGLSPVDMYIPPAGATVAQVAVAKRVESGTSVPVALPTSGQVGLLTMSLVAGERIAVDVTGSTFGNSTSYARVSILAPNGTVVVAPTGFASAGVFLEPAVATQDGTYTVLVDPQGTRVGSANVALYRVPADVVVSASAGGDPVSVSTSVAGQNGRVVFAGYTGQKVSLSLSDSTFGTSTMVQVLKPNGAVLTSKSLSGTSMLIEGLTLPSDGDYTIVINPYRAGAGNANVRVSDVSSVVVNGAADGSDVVVSTALPGQYGVVRFDGIAGDRLAVQTVTSTFWSTASWRLSLISPSGLTLIAPQRSEPGSFIDAIELPETGQYRLKVVPTGSETGSVRFRLYTVPDDVEVSAVVDGDPVTVGTSVAGQNGRVVFAGTTGQQVAVTLSDSTLGTAPMVLRVLRPDGSVLKEVWSDGTSGFIDTPPLPSDGDYTVVIDPTGSSTVSVSVQLRTVLADVVVSAVPGGDPVVVGTSVSGQNGRVVFAGTASQTVAVTLSGSTWGTEVTLLRVLGPDGSVVTATAFYGELGYIDTFTLPSDGEYTIVIDPSGLGTGSASVLVHAVPVDAVVSAVVGGDPVVVGTSVSGQDGQVVFAGVTGQKVAVTLSGSTFGTSPTNALVVGPDGSVLKSTSIYATSTFIDAFTLPVDGDYTVMIDPDGPQTGTVSVTLHDAPDAVYDIAVGDPLLIAKTTTPGQDIRLDAELVAGTTYAVRIDSGSGASTVTVRDPAGNVLHTSWNSGPDYGVQFVAAVGGVHTITLDPNDTLTGSWRFELLDRVGLPRVALPPTSSDWYTKNSLAVTWSAMYTEQISGYAVVQDSNPATEPSTVTTTASSGTITAPEGESWLHVRAVLPDGTLGPVAHTRILVDTVLPVLGDLSSQSHPDSTVLYADRAVHVEWDAPEDTSGVVGYSIEASQSPSSTPDVTVDTTETSYTFNLDSNGLWYFRVRPIDAAGNVGEAQQYEVNVDADAPAAPEVTATHEDGVASSQRTLVANFTSGDGDPVSAWSAVVDQSPDTVPDPADGRVEPRLVETLTPGVWWLHVSAGDALGRWGEPTHIQVVVAGGGITILQPAQSWFWGEGVIDVACDGGAMDLSLASVDEEGLVQNIGPLTADGEHRSASWDPTGTVGGERVWPDGSYSLVVVDALGNEVSDRVPVTVAVESSTIDRILSDYQAGIIDST